MHQHPRPPTGAGSPASPTINPYQMNNPREGSRGGHSRLNSDVPLYSETDDGSGLQEDSVVVTGPSNEARRKLDQIVQNYHTKAAIVILQSRVALPTIRGKDDSPKVNRWFQLETDDTDAFREELRLWKACDSFDNRPPPLILETYLDTSDLSNKQSLVIVDEHGRHHDVSEALNDPKSSRSSKSSSSRHRRQRTEVVLERWMVQLKDAPGDRSYDYGGMLPAIYKKCIVFFRSLYATTRFTPVAKFVKAIGKIPSSRSGLRVNCRIVNGENRSPSSFDSLTVPLFNSDGEVTSRFFLGETESPAGIFSAEVCYRNDCNFRVEDSETLLSERFMGAEDYFQPTLASREDGRRDTRTTEIGSLPAHRRFTDEAEPTQTYGSLSTFHGEAPRLGTSPMSALRAAKNMGSAPYSPPIESSAYSRPAPTQRPSSRALESIAMARRPSVSFNPFKAGSLSGTSLPSSSAPQGEMLPPASPHSLTRNSGMGGLTQPRNRSSLTAGMPASLRGAPSVPDNIAPSSSSSPRPAPIRYSSSFSHRRGRLSYGGTSRADDDQGSSGKQSLSSSAQPGSGILAEAGASSGSFQTDDDNLSDFLKVLESNKNLSSFQTQKGNDAARRTTTQLSRFQSMRESHNVLTESLSSSMLLHRSSISSSRQLSSVPPMVAATSISTSSSPGKPVSPHTPHTPAIPSRLSANSIVEYAQPRRFRTSSRTEEARIEDISGDEEEGPGTTAIDIPTSPRPYQYHNRRSSSVSQQHRTMGVDDDLGDLPFHRSISLGADDREPPSLNDLRGFGQVSGNAPDERERVLQPAARVESPVAGGPEEAEREERQVPRRAGAVHRPKLGGVGRGAPTGSSGSLGAGSGSERGQGRYSWARQQGQTQGVDEGDDEYPLLFDMSELGRNGEQSRRSLEEGRGGGESGVNSRRGSSRRGW